MSENMRVTTVIHSARTVGGGAVSPVTVTLTGPPDMFPHRRTGPCTRTATHGGRRS